MEEGDLSALLGSLEGGGGDVDRIYAQVYGELKRLAHYQLRSERSDHSLQPTALVHEAYMKLVGSTKIAWKGRRHFFAVASRAMRRILVDHARTRGRKKRGGNRQPLTLDEATGLAVVERDTDIVALDEALRRLQKTDEIKARVVELRFFGGLTNEEVGEALELSLRTVERHWAFARAWLYRELERDES